MKRWYLTDPTPPSSFVKVLSLSLSFLLWFVFAVHRTTQTLQHSLHHWNQKGKKEKKKEKKCCDHITAENRHSFPLARNQFNYQHPTLWCSTNSRWWCTRRYTVDFDANHPSPCVIERKNHFKSRKIQKKSTGFDRIRKHGEDWVKRIDKTPLIREFQNESNDWLIFINEDKNRLFSWFLFVWFFFSFCRFWHNFVGIGVIDTPSEDGPRTKCPTLVFGLLFFLFYFYFFFLFLFPFFFLSVSFFFFFNKCSLDISSVCVWGDELRSTPSARGRWNRAIMNNNWKWLTNWARFLLVLFLFNVVYVCLVAI